jgi:hypothetical protein
LELITYNNLKLKNMKNILNSVMLLLAVTIVSSCSKVPKADKADASFVAQKLDLDGNVVESTSANLTVPLVIKTINGIDQKVALVGFEFTGKGDHVSLWTGDSCKVKVPTKVDGITLEPTEWGYQIAASDYERYLANDFTQKGIQLTGGKLSYKYWKAGTYKAYCIATNADEYNSNGLTRDAKFITITVTE